MRGEVGTLRDLAERAERLREPARRRGQRGEDEAPPRALAACGDVVAEGLRARHVARHAEAVDGAQEGTLADVDVARHAGPEQEQLDRGPDAAAGDLGLAGVDQLGGEGVVGARARGHAVRERRRARREARAREVEVAAPRRGEVVVDGGAQERVRERDLGRARGRARARAGPPRAPRRARRSGSSSPAAAPASSSVQRGPATAAAATSSSVAGPTPARRARTVAANDRGAGSVP